MDFRQLARYRRINVVGTSGSGKTTFSRELARRLDLPLFELDQLHWQPNWQATPTDELREKVRDITSADEWLIEGNYTKTTPEKWARVELVIWLDHSFLRTLVRVTKRAVHRSLTQTELWPGTGNRETLRKAFLSRDSVIWWMITSYRRNRQKYLAAIDSPDCQHIQFVRLTSPRQVARFLDGIQQAFNQPIS